MGQVESAISRDSFGSQSGTRGDAIYTWSAEKGTKKRKRGLYNEVEHILNAPEISPEEYEAKAWKWKSMGESRF